MSVTLPAPNGGVGETVTLTGEALARWKYQRYMQDYLATVQSLDDNIGRPKALLQLFTSDDFMRVLNQSDQHLKGLFLELDSDASLPQFAGSQVDLEDPKADRRRRGASASLIHR